MVLGLTLAFLLMAACILWFVIGAKGFVPIKIAAIIIGCGFSIAVFNSLHSYKGWPSVEDTPNKFMIKWVVVNEPDKSKGEEGDIFIWTARPPADLLKDGDIEDPNFLYYTGASHEPRAYRLPYSKELHKTMQKAQEALKKGQPVMVDKTSAGQKGQEGNGKKGDGKEGQGKAGPKGKDGNKGEALGSWNFSKKQRWEVHKLPPPKLPRKVFQ